MLQIKTPKGFTKPIGKAKRQKVLVLFGTRPEVIKLAPVIRELDRRQTLRSLVVSSSQHKNLLKPFLDMLDLRVGYDLGVMKSNQGPNHVCSKVLEKLDKLLDMERPSMIVVQGDTSTTLAGAIAGFNRQIPVAHVEAGLRSGNVNSPFPEEMNRRLVSQIASIHFAATPGNGSTLLDEGVPTERVFVTGNPVVDSLQTIAISGRSSQGIADLIRDTEGRKRILLTTHRRESFGRIMKENLRALASFVKDHEDICLICPVHPNPNVRDSTRRILANNDRVYLLEPVDYVDFVALMKASWLIVSDSGGVQEEAPSLGKALLVLRENTERPEAIRSGVAKLVGGDAKVLREMLEANYVSDAWLNTVKKVPNPFGDGTAAKQIVDIIEGILLKDLH